MGFEQNLEALEHIQKHPSPPGRWVLMPRQEERFVGPRGRTRARVRERRRRVLGVLGEAIAFTLLIGAFPPLRAMWSITAILVGLTAIYVALLLRLKLRATQKRRTVTLPDTDISVVRSYQKAPLPGAAAAR
ncbi:MAG TPA: hypothetical protein VE754_01465 [Actinomycetota bacterium]|nr:hypothetical protein [Actinomycetota bacterium]